MTQVLEGTWKEISAHEPEWHGKRLRVAVEVLESFEAIETNGAANGARQETLAESFARIGTIDGPETDISSRAKELWGQYVEEKHRRITQFGSKRDPE